jgi:hypothetical protein
MLCFRDMTFCGSDCTNIQCHRFFGAPEREAAARWWGSPDAPVAFSDFSPSCADYAPPRAGPASTCIETINGDPDTAIRLSRQIKVF